MLFLKGAVVTVGLLMHLTVSILAFIHAGFWPGVLTLLTFLAGDLYWAYQWWNSYSLLILGIGIVWAFMQFLHSAEQDET